jgi:hypothetical protein
MRGFAAQPGRGTVMQESIVEVYSAANEQQAHLVLLALLDVGIHAQVVGENLRGATGEIPLGWTTSPRIWVPESEYEAARKVIACWEATCADGSAHADVQTWICPDCGMEVEGNFDICWNCQHHREKS